MDTATHEDGRTRGPLPAPRVEASDPRRPGRVETPNVALQLGRSHSPTPVRAMTEWTDVPVFGRPPHGPRATVRPSAYGLLVDDDGRLAVVRTPQGWFLPGGGMEAGEAPPDTVAREVLEECGF